MVKSNKRANEISTSKSSVSDDSEDDYYKNKPSFKSTEKCKKIHYKKARKNKETAPPNKYSSLSIFPSKQDIVDGFPFLRSNIVEGKYENCEHYLDVQFRLFREDYISPLREGIKEYKENVKDCKERFMGSYNFNDIKKKLKSTYIYEDVKITNPELDNMFGVIHTLKFNRFPESYVWKGNSRLQEGTLLCLSSDEFIDSFIFATVTYRTDDVKEGKVKVCFEQQQHDILYDVPPTSETYIMMEMRSAYFESYRHTLSVLKTFNEDNFPMKQYIVKAEQVVDAPCYLDNETLYDFSSILEKEDFLDEEIPDDLQKVPILEHEKWPTQVQLGLDFTQYCVLKAALTKEFCIIQGPPGTGKTFMGLKIVKMLLHNSNVWYPEFIDYECPILIVCYTNHALDQFLEKIVDFTNEVVRVGDQGESEVLENFKLQNLRRNCLSGDVSNDISHRRTRLLKKQTAIKDQINAYNFVIEAASCLIFKPKILKKYIKEDHYKSLVSKYGIAQGIRSVLEKWLEIPYHQDLEDSFNQNLGSSTDKLDTGEKDMNIEEICSWIKWELETFDKHQSHYGWNKPAPKEYKEDIIKNMKDLSMVTVEEMAAIEDITNLKVCDRWRLYRFWVAEFITFIVKTVKSLQEEFIDITKHVKESRWKDVAIVRHAKVVGMTCTGTAKNHNLLEALAPRIVIIEEAAEVLEAHLISSLPKSTKHLILIGDHQQLRPLPSVYDLAVECKLDVSLFERMVKNEVEYSTLVSQHRMRPCIADLLVGPIYNELSHHESVYHYEDIVGVGRNMYFISLNSTESKLDGSSSFYNLFEAKMVVRLTRYLLLQGYESSQITVLATYSGQVKMIRAETSKILEENKNISVNDVKVSTVDNYQGEENDIIIVSFVRSNYEGKIGFLSTPNRICVALSRARKGFYCFGNFEFLASESNLWKSIVAKLNEVEAIGSSLTLICQKHSVKTNIECSNDYKNVFDGGCTEVCGMMLECGHFCKRFCHFTDKEHKQYKCEEKCTRKCKNGHACEKMCHEECGNCTKYRCVSHPKCGHRLPVPCYVDDLSKFKCQENCDRMLTCGHVCTKLCYESCGHCLKEIPWTLPCKHTVFTVCSERDIDCTEPCRRLLPCGHQCSKKCGEECAETCKRDVAVQLPCNHITTVPCTKRNERIACKQSCGAILSCGHKCPGNCTRCFQGTKHVECWLTCGKTVDGRGTCKLRCGHTNRCNLNVVLSKSFPPDFGKSESDSGRLGSDKHMVNKWKTGYNDDYP